MVPGVRGKRKIIYLRSQKQADKFLESYSSFLTEKKWKEKKTRIEQRRKSISIVLGDLRKKKKKKKSGKKGKYHK